MSESKQVALITGANKGLGFETARQLGKKGVTVLVAARDTEKGEAAAKKLQAEGITAQAIKLDVTNAADRSSAAKEIEKQFGHLDILINNAGVSLEDFSKGNHTSTTTDEVVKNTFETNLFSQVAITQELLPLLKKSSAGRIVNLSSILGSLTLHSQPGSPIYDAKVFAYSASKAALNMFTIHLAHELKDTKIKVNSVHPGWVKTDMGTDAAPMEVEEGAKTSVELATIGPDGPTGGFVHLGQTLPW